MSRAFALCLCLLLGCGAEVQPVVCPAWDSLRNWTIEGSPVVLQPDNCGRLTSLQFLGPGEITLSRPQGGLVGIRGYATCEDVTYRVGTLPFVVKRPGVFYVSSVLVAPSTVTVRLGPVCEATINMEFRP